MVHYKNPITLKSAVFKHCKQNIALSRLLPVISMYSMCACKRTQYCTKKYAAEPEFSRIIQIKRSLTVSGLDGSSPEDFVYSCLRIVWVMMYLLPHISRGIQYTDARILEYIKAKEKAPCCNDVQCFLRNIVKATLEPKRGDTQGTMSSVQLSFSA